MTIAELQLLSLDLYIASTTHLPNTTTPPTTNEAHLPTTLLQYIANPTAGPLHGRPIASGTMGMRMGPCLRLPSLEDTRWRVLGGGGGGLPEGGLPEGVRVPDWMSMTQACWQTGSAMVTEGVLAEGVPHEVAVVAAEGVPCAGVVAAGQAHTGGPVASTMATGSMGESVSYGEDHAAAHGQPYVVQVLVQDAHHTRVLVVGDAVLSSMVQEAGVRSSEQARRAASAMLRSWGN